jgi:hypothetical protein
MEILAYIEKKKKKKKSKLVSSWFYPANLSFHKTINRNKSKDKYTNSLSSEILDFSAVY